MDNIERAKQIERAEERKRLISGAKVLAWGAERGLSEDDLIDIITDPRARQQALKSGVVSKQAVRRLIAQAQQIEDIDNYEVDPFGQDQTEYYTYGPEDYVSEYNDQENAKLKELKAYFEDESPKARKARQKRDPLGYQAVKENLGETYADINDRYRKVAPQGAMDAPLQQALRLLNSNIEPIGAYTAQGGVIRRPGVDLMKYNSAPVVSQYNLLTQAPSAAALSGSIELNDVREQVKAQQSLAEQLVRAERDSRLYSPVIAQQNYDQADALSQQIAQSFTAGGAGALADQNIARIPDLQTLGGTGVLSGFSMYSTEPVLSAEDLSPAYQLGNVPETPLTTVNHAGLGALDFVDTYKQGLKTQGRVIGNYPQVDITLETTNFINKLRDNPTMQQLGIIPQAENIRSVHGLQVLLDRINATNIRPDGTVKSKFFTSVPVEGQKRPINVFNQLVGGNELMNKLDMTGGERERLATALFQIEAARRSPVNQEAKAAYSRRDPNNKLSSRNNSQMIGPQLPGSRRPIIPGQEKYFFDAAEAMLTDRPDLASRSAMIQGAGTRSKKDFASSFGQLNDPLAQTRMIGLDKANEAEQRTYKLRGNFYSPTADKTRVRVQGPQLALEGLKPRPVRPEGVRQVQPFDFTRARGPIRAREHNMAQLEETRQNRSNKNNPMTRDEYVGRVQDTREKQIQNYVAQVRESRDLQRRANSASAIISSLPPAARRSRYPRGSEVRDTQVKLNSEITEDLQNMAGQAPADPKVQFATGYGSELAQVQQAASTQSSDMQLSDLIRGLRQQQAPASGASDIQQQRRVSDQEDADFTSLVRRLNRRNVRGRKRADFYRQLGLDLPSN